MSTTTHPRLDCSLIRQAAAGRWPEILQAVAGIAPELLDGRHHPCPKCGGVDRFRFIDQQAGALLCNQCFSVQNGDGLAAVAWARGCGFVESLRLVAGYLGLEGSDGRPANGQPDGNGRPRIVATYDYRDEAGTMLYQVCRMEPKDFRQRRLKDGGGWEWSTKGTRKVLYRLPELLAAEPVQVVAVVEGEKDVDRLTSMGLLATCNVGGAGKWRAEYAEPLRGRRVVVVPDCDEAGRQHALQVAKSLRGVAASTKVVELPGLPDKGDVSDWLDNGGTVDELGRLADDAPEWTPPKDEPKPERFPAVTCRELASGDYSVEYYVDGVFVARQPTMLAGPHKSLKTSIAWDLAISLQTGRPFLGCNRFLVGRYCRVAFFSGEGGLSFLQDVGRRVCASKGVGLEDIGDGMVISDRLPRLDRQVDLDALGEFLAKYDIDVAFLDPCYLALGGIDAGNVLSMGERFHGVNEVCAKTETTPVFLHHLKRGRVDPFAPADLGDLSWSGFAEFAGSWLLLSKREPYIPTGTALHRLWLVCGGRAGHSSLDGLDVQEGVTGSEVGRYWHARVFALEQVDKQRQEAAEQARRAKHDEWLDADRREVVEAAAKVGGPETKNGLRERVGCGYRRFGKAFASLVADGTLQVATVKKENGQTYEGWELNREAEL